MRCLAFEWKKTKHIAWMLLLVLLASPAIGSDIQRVSLPEEVKQEMRVNPDDDIKGKIWNRWTSENFVVCSLNDTQAQYLNANLEKVKSWIYDRWGLSDTKFSAECRLICVDDKALFKKLFGLDESKVEIRRDNTGKIKLSVIYILLDNKPSKTVPIPLTEVCLAEFEQHNGVKFGWWAHRGISQLNGTIDDIRQDIIDLQPVLSQDKAVFFSKGLFTTTEQDYWKQTPAVRHIYDRCAVCLCLFFRKEFGQEKFLECLRDTAVGKNAESGLSTIYKFNSFNQCDLVFKSYMMDLSADASGRSNRHTPDSYLQIRSR